MNSRKSHRASGDSIMLQGGKVKLLESKGGLTSMRSRPPTVTVAAILLVLLSLFDFPWLYRLLFPGTVEPPAFLLYSGYLLGIVGILVAIGLWMMRKWSLWATIVVCVLNFLSGAPGVLFAPGGAL